MARGRVVPGQVLYGSLRSFMMHRAGLIRRDPSWTSCVNMSVSLLETFRTRRGIGVGRIYLSAGRFFGGLNDVPR